MRKVFFTLIFFATVANAGGVPLATEEMAFQRQMSGPCGHLWRRFFVILRLEQLEKRRMKGDSSVWEDLHALNLGYVRVPIFWFSDFYDLREKVMKAQKNGPAVALLSWLLLKINIRIEQRERAQRWQKATYLPTYAAFWVLTFRSHSWEVLEGCGHILLPFCF